MSLAESEYTALRQTIASRGTARMALLPVTFIGWAIVAATLTVLGNQPATSLFTLAVLAAGFEAIHALHVGVERIGRYLQVFYEGTPEGPLWETTAMSVGPALPGGGVDPLFTAVFTFATFVNLLPAIVPSPTTVELFVIGVLHAAFVARLVRARGAATRQRAVDLESYRAVKMRMSNGKDSSAG
jgi:hypothetical protein